ncbi:MAG: hypothetical protein KBS94_06820 [Prevotella sp.]|nr:hypothetical protein [Candidatus Equicola faecalis]
MFEKGHEKYGGRKKGTPNKTALEVRRFIQSFIEDYFDGDKFVRDVEALEPRERIGFVSRLLRYVIAEKREVEAQISMGELTKSVNLFGNDDENDR